MRGRVLLLVVAAMLVVVAMLVSSMNWADSTITSSIQ